MTHTIAVFTVKTPEDGQGNCPKLIEFKSKNKFEKLVHLVGFIIKKMYLLSEWFKNRHPKLRSPEKPTACIFKKKKIIIFRLVMSAKHLNSQITKMKICSAEELDPAYHYDCGGLSRHTDLGYRLDKPVVGFGARIGR
jgi:hypothetical protein